MSRGPGGFSPTWMGGPDPHRAFPDARLLGEAKALLREAEAARAASGALRALAVPQLAPQLRAQIQAEADRLTRERAAARGPFVGPVRTAAQAARWEAIRRNLTGPDFNSITPRGGQMVRTEGSGVGLILALLGQPQTEMFVPSFMPLGIGGAAAIPPLRGSGAFGSSFRTPVTPPEAAPPPGVPPPGVPGTFNGMPAVYPAVPPGWQGPLRPIEIRGVRVTQWFRGEPYGGLPLGGVRGSRYEGVYHTQEVYLGIPLSQQSPARYRQAGERAVLDPSHPDFNLPFDWRGNPGGSGGSGGFPSDFRTPATPPPGPTPSPQPGGDPWGSAWGGSGGDYGGGSWWDNVATYVAYVAAGGEPSSGGMPPPSAGGT